MFAALALLFIVVPFVELYVILQVGHAIGVVNTLAVMIAMSVAGGWLMKREGLSVLRRARRRVETGGVPGRELVDGVLVLFGGALLLTPGFLTDVFGLVLLVPPTRAAVRAAASRWLARRATTVHVYRGEF